MAIVEQPNNFMFSEKLKSIRPERHISIGFVLVFLLLLLCSGTVRGVTLTNVAAVNVTPSSFSVVWVSSSSSIIPDVSVFADAGGVTNLNGQLGVEFFPLHTGDPSATNAYQKRLSQTALRQKSLGMGLMHVRFSGCSPNTTYYYKIQVTDTNTQQTVTYPSSGPLPAVTTAMENAFVTQSKQLVINLPGFDPSGLIVTLSNTNSATMLAAVAGDGVANNQVFFNVNDLIATLGKTNYLPLGNQEFAVKFLGSSQGAAAQTYSLYFTSDFGVGEENVYNYNQFLSLKIGSAIVRAGTSGSIPLDLNASSVTNLTMTMNLETNRFSSLTLQPLSPLLGSASLQAIDSNHIQISMSAASGQTFQGNQEIAQLNFSVLSNQPSAFVPFKPQTIQAKNADSSVTTNIAVQSGRLVIIGNEPLLETTLNANQRRDLTLYGKPGASYQIEYATNLSNPSSWTLLTRLPMTNLVQVLTGLDASKASMFLRASEFTASDPILDQGSSIDGLPSFVLYGTPWSAYEVDYSANLNPPFNWSLLSRVPLTNSFQFITGIGATNVTYSARILTGNPPVLEPRIVNNVKSLMVYGQAGTNYVLQYSTNLSGTVTWNPLLNYTMTNSFQLITNVGNTNPVIFYRIKKP
jgi:hypothetical protein